jgi:hypothetical protein
MRDCVQALWWGRCACGGMRAVPRLCIKLYPVIRLTTEENHGKTLVGVAEKRLTEGCWARFVWSTWWPFHGRPRPVCWPSPPLACASGDLGEPSVRYLPSCRTKGFPASAKFRVKTLRQGSDVVGERRKTELPNPREFACYWCTKVPQ